MTVPTVGGGTSVQVQLQCDSDKPIAKRSAIGHAKLTAARSDPAADPSTLLRSQKVVPLWLPSTPKVQANRRRRAANEGAFAGRIDAIGASLVPRKTGMSAAARIDAIAR